LLRDFASRRGKVHPPHTPHVQAGWGPPSPTYTSADSGCTFQRLRRVAQRNRSANTPRTWMLARACDGARNVCFEFRFGPRSATFAYSTMQAGGGPHPQPARRLTADALFSLRRVAQRNRSANTPRTLMLVRACDGAAVRTCDGARSCRLSSSLDQHSRFGSGPLLIIRAAFIV
jgi:hypothetical protein